MIHSLTDSRWATSGDELLEPTFDGSGVAKTGAKRMIRPVLATPTVTVGFAVATDLYFVNVVKE